MMEEIRIIAGNNVSYAILPVTPFAKKGKRPRQLNSAYTNRYAALIKYLLLQMNQYY